MERNLSATPGSQAPSVASALACMDHAALQLPLAVLYSLIFVVGLVGNLVALWVFFCFQSKRNSVRVFLINVALADLLLVVCLPFRILYHSRANTWSLGAVPCRLVGLLFYMNMYISITLLGTISVDRFLKIHRGAQARRRLLSTRGSVVLCAAVWSGAAALTLTLLLSKNHSHPERCFHYKLLHASRWRAYVNICVLVFFWLVFVSLVASYGRIAVKLLRTSRANPELPNAARYTRTARKSFFVLFLFVVCFAPYHAVRPFYIWTQISDTSCSWRSVADRANEVVLLLSALNSCLDPVMYFLLSSSVRKEVLRLLSAALCTRDAAGVSGSISTGQMDGRTRRTPEHSLMVPLRAQGGSECPLRDRGGSECPLGGTGGQ